MKPLIAERLAQDPRLAEATRMIHQALDDAQQHILAPHPPDPARTPEYRDIIDRFTELRGGSLFYPYLGSGVGRGPLVELADGSIKYDMITGIGVHGLGHGHRALIDAMLTAATEDLVMQGNLQQNLESIKLAEQFITLAQRHGAKLPHCFLTTSGAMANENALKMLFAAQYPANRLLAFERCFMGRTLALATITDRPAYRPGLPQVLAVDYVPFFDADRPGPSTAQAVATLESHLHRYPHQHAGMCMELVQGEAGYYPGSTEFFQALIQVLKAHHVPVLVDEIQTFGRTTQPFAFQHFRLDPLVDMITVGKFTQVCATLFADRFKPRPGLISQTFTGATSAMRASQVILDHLSDGDLFGLQGRIAHLHDRFVRNLTAINRDHSNAVNGPFGIGGMIAFQLYDGHAKPTRDFLHRLFEAGVIAFVAGANPARVRMLPPMAVMQEADVDAVTRIIANVVGEQPPPASRS